MAMQAAGVAPSKILILVGAGLTGSIILKNGRFLEVMAELQELMNGVNQAEVFSNHYDTSFLASQIRNLAQEVRDLTLSRPVAIFNEEHGSSGSLSSYIMPAAAVGALGYCYMWWKGWSFSDVMFITKRNMASAVANMSKQLDQVSAALAVTRKHLTQRLENLDGKVDEQKEISKLIRNEVHEARTDLSQIGFDVESIQNMVSSLEGKIGLLESKQDMTNSGIYYLCEIAGGIKDGFNTKFFQESSSKLQLNGSSPTFSEVEPLQGLQFLTDALKPGEEHEKIEAKPSKNSFAKAAAIHRSFPNGISLRREGLIL